MINWRRLWEVQVEMPAGRQVSICNLGPVVPTYSTKCGCKASQRRETQTNTNPLPSSSYSNWEWIYMCAYVCVCVHAHSVASVLSDSVTLWTVASQAPLFMEFSRQEYWLEWAAIAILFPRGSSRLRDRTEVSCIAGRFFTIEATREAHSAQKAGPNLHDFCNPFFKLKSNFHMKMQRF